MDVLEVMMALVAGVDSSTQSVKVLVCESSSGEIISSSSAPHPTGTEVNPQSWWHALTKALNEKSITDIGGMDQISAISIAGQQHGLVLLDNSGDIIRPALLWNDVRSAPQAELINREFPDIAERTGSSLVASFTASKLRWVFEKEPANAKRIAAVCLPHDWLTWKLSGSQDIGDITTDRSDASGTGYFNAMHNTYDREIVEFCIGRSDIYLPRIVEKNGLAGKINNSITTRLGAGAGDNAGAAFGLNLAEDDVVISLGTSGTAFTISTQQTHDSSGMVAGFADLTGNFLPLVCTLNAARIFDTAAQLLNVSHEKLGELALQSTPGAHGLTLIPYFEGERTPNLPNARGALVGLSLENNCPADIARAYIEGALCGMVDASRRLKNGVSIPKRIILIGGAARNPAVQEIAATLFGCDVLVPPALEYVARGAARQAAWTLNDVSDLPSWTLGDSRLLSSSYQPEVFARYSDVRDRLYVTN
mgnify:FL=1